MKKSAIPLWKIVLLSILIAFSPLILAGQGVFKPLFFSLNAVIIIVYAIIALLLIFLSLTCKNKMLANKPFLILVIMNVLVIELFLWISITHYWDFTLLQIEVNKACSMSQNTWNAVSPGSFARFCK